MTRIYIFADDSMEGRNSPLASNARGNAYIVRELTRLGLRPAGDLGTYLQTLPYVTRAVSPRSSITTTDGVALAYGTDFSISSRGNTRIIDNAQVVYGGVLGDTSRMLSADQVMNRFVLVSPAAAVAGDPAAAGGRGAGGGGAGGGRGGGRGGGGAATTRYAGAAAIATIQPDLTAGGGGGGAAGRGGGRGGGPILNDVRAPRAAA